MKAEQYNQIKEQVPSIKNYQKEVEWMIIFFTEKKLNIEAIPIVFWNHIITLFERIDNNEQNTIPLDQTEEMSLEAKELTDDFIEYMNKHKKFHISDFEKYLLTIYYEQIKDI